MQSPWSERGGHETMAFVVTVVVAGLVLASVFPMLAQGRVRTATDGPVHYQQETETINASVDAEKVSSLSCLDMSTEEVSQRLDRMASGRFNTLIRRAAAKMPAPVRNTMAGERINFKVGSTYFSAVVNQNAEIERIQTGRLENPTIRGQTDCETLKGIIKSDSRTDALQAAINQDKITWDGVTTTSEVGTSYGGKAVQTYQVVSSGKAGDAGDAADGFKNGLMLN